MRSLEFRRGAFSTCVAAVLFAGCAGSQPPTPVGPTQSVASERHVRPPGPDSLLYSFMGPTTDGANPQATLLGLNGEFYGTTYAGGTNKLGTIFSVTTGGVETVLHSFAGGAADGAYPISDLTYLSSTGKLYGTTTQGGGAGCGGVGCGTVFSINPNGTGYLPIHNFLGSPTDGAEPMAGLTEVGGELYGTTVEGGTGCTITTGCGTVFGMTKLGAELWVYSVTGANGAAPASDLTYMAGVLYGTTFGGGTSNLGTVFSINTTGLGYTVMHDFAGPDGAQPFLSAMGPKHNTLYGTTEHGGANGSGTLFSITTANVESVLHSFGGTVNDGALPQTSLICVSDTLYGTTQIGGGLATGYGTIFSFNLHNNSYHVVHRFSGGTNDGEGPLAGLSYDINNDLAYGTTVSAGALGFGAVYTIGGL